MITAILFDLDGTLLDIDLNRFFDDYFGALGPVIASASAGELDARSGLDAVMAATEAMCRSTDARTNQEVFEEHFSALTGIDLAAPASADEIARFYAEEFPTLGVAHKPRSGGVAAVRAAHSAGLRVALATNPLFPRAAILERMRWAGVSPDWFEVITTYEVMRACKPDARYFLQTAQMLGVEAEHCLMVGDDALLDLPAAATGMKTFFVGEGPQPDGDLDDLARIIESGKLR